MTDRCIGLPDGTSCRNRVPGPRLRCDSCWGKTFALPDGQRVAAFAVNGIPTPVAHRYVNDQCDAVRFALAHLPTDPDVLDRLSGDPELIVRRAAAANGALHGHSAFYLLTSDDEVTLIALAANPGLPSEARDFLTDHPSAAVRAALSLH